MAGNNVAKQAGSMGAATFLSRIGGLVREQVFAFHFGASDVADAFNIAFRIPNLLRDLFAEGAMSAAFVPNFTRVLQASKDAAFRLLMAVLWALFVGLSLLSIIGIIFSPELVSLYAGGFKSVLWKYELTVSLTRWMFPFFPMVAMAAVAMGALNALGFFFLPAFAPVLFNVASIFAGVVLVPLAKMFPVPFHPIYAMAFGVVLGGFLQFYVQWQKVRKEGLSFKTHGLGEAWKKPWLVLKEVPEVKTVLWLIIPGTIGLAATQLNILINSMFATSKGSGAVSWLNYAFRLMQFPIGIFGVSLAAATLPQVTRALMSDDRKAAGEQLNASLRMSFAVNGPAAAGLMGIGLPLVQMLFQYGSFRFSDSIQTAQALFWYGLGLPGYSAVKILVPVFYALGSTRVPVISSFVLVAINAVLNYLFLFVFDYPFWALALATSATATLNALVLFWALTMKLPGLGDLKLIRATAFYAIVSVGVWVACFASILAVDYSVLLLVRSGNDLIRDVLKLHWLIWLSKIVLAMGTSALFWLGLGRLLKLEEINRAWGVISRRLFRRKSA